MPFINLTQIRRTSAAKDEITITTQHPTQAKPRIRLGFPDQVLRDLHWQKGDLIEVRFDADDGMGIARRAKTGRTLIVSAANRGEVTFAWVAPISQERHTSGYDIKDDEVWFSFKLTKDEATEALK